MTDRREEGVQLSDNVGLGSAQDEGQAKAEGEQDEGQGDGTHGRPSDDADPGHS